MGCAPQFRAPAPPEVSGPLDPAAKPNPRARPSPNEPLPRMRLPPSSTHSHCNSRKPPARTGASRRPRAAWRKPPSQTRASRRPRAAARKPPAQTGTSCRPRREASAHPKERKSRSHISTSAIVCASTTPATSTILSRDMVRGCSVMAYVGRGRTSSGPRLPGQSLRLPSQSLRLPGQSPRLPSQSLRTDGFARATPRQCVGKRMPPQAPPRDVDLWHKTLTFMVFGEMSPNNSNCTPP